MAKRIEIPDYDDKGERVCIEYKDGTTGEFSYICSAFDLVVFSASKNACMYASISLSRRSLSYG